jgi:hypothetical protein
MSSYLQLLKTRRSRWIERNDLKRIYYTNALQLLCKGSGHWAKIRTFSRKGLVFLFRWVNSSNIICNSLGFHDISWLSLNSLLHLTGLARASTSASNAMFSGLSVKTAATVQFSLSASAFGKELISARLTSYWLLSVDGRPVFKSDVEGWLLIFKFQFEAWESHSPKLSRIFITLKWTVSPRNPRQ